MTRFLALAALEAALLTLTVAVARTGWHVAVACAWVVVIGAVAVMARSDQ